MSELKWWKKVSKKKKKHNDPWEYKVPYEPDDEAPYLHVTGEVWPTLSLGDAQISLYDKTTDTWKVFPAKGGTIHSLIHSLNHVDDVDVTALQENIALTSVGKSIILEPLGVEKYFDFSNITWNPIPMANLTQSFQTPSDATDELFKTYVSLVHHMGYPPLIKSTEQTERGLYDLFPGLTNTLYYGECPADPKCEGVYPGECSCNTCGNAYSLRTWIIHLNDKHKWARADADLRRRNERDPEQYPTAEGPTIHAWLTEGVEKYGWDLTMKEVTDVDDPVE